MAEELTLSQYIPASDICHGSVLTSGDYSKKLESVLFNHVALGQWEAGGATITSLAGSEEPDTRSNVRELLKILIIEAASYW